MYSNTLFSIVSRDAGSTNFEIEAKANEFPSIDFNCEFFGKIKDVISRWL